MPQKVLFQDAQTLLRSSLQPFYIPHSSQQILARPPVSAHTVSSIVLLHILYNWFSRFLGKTPTLNMIEFVLSKCSTWGLLFFLPKLANFAPSSSLCLSLEDKELLPITEFSSPPPLFYGSVHQRKSYFFPRIQTERKRVFGVKKVYNRMEVEKSFRRYGPRGRVVEKSFPSRLDPHRTPLTDE